VSLGDPCLASSYVRITPIFVFQSHPLLALENDLTCCYSICPILRASGDKLMLLVEAWLRHALAHQSKLRYHLLLDITSRRMLHAKALPLCVSISIISQLRQSTHWLPPCLNFNSGLKPLRYGFIFHETPITIIHREARHRSFARMAGTRALSNDFTRISFYMPYRRMLHEMF
jgi:hypothetical protein